MPAPREPSHPPSEPQSARASRTDWAGDDRPGRLQLGAALLAGLVLVGSGLYMWRRPRGADTAGDEASPAASAAALGDAGVILGAPGVDAGTSSPVVLSEPRVLACQDRGTKKTAPDACDRLVPVEKALADAIHQAATCVAPEAGAAGGTIEYVADVSFSRHKVNLSLPRAGRSVHDRKVVRACSTAVRGSLEGLGGALDGIDHQHARYKIAVTATYRGSAPGG
jgi:hypothetical protein